jgi:translation initiation factor 4E
MTFHELKHKWTLYAHMPHDTDWTIDSYKSILQFDKAEQAIALYETIPPVMVNNCMLFLMKENVKPIWEHDLNRNGGCFSYKVTSSNVNTAWKTLSYMLIGENISKNNDFKNNINGIAISPKKNFCIIKIWMKNCDFQHTRFINDVKGLDKHGVLFKKHRPEF